MWKGGRERGGRDGTASGEKMETTEKLSVKLIQLVTTAAIEEAKSSHTFLLYSFTESCT